MERVAWTDERLDDFARHVDVRFDQMDARFDRVDSDIRELRGAVQRINLTLVLGVLGVIAALLAQGVA